jgi:ribosomal protein L40E
MALINCPECETEVSDKAEKCPKCHYPINQQLEVSKSESPTVVNVKAKEGCFLQTLNIGCLIIFFIIGVIVLVYFAS